MMDNLVNYELRRLGQTDLYVSPVAFGGWPIAGMTSLNVNHADSIKTVQMAIGSGINFLDTAFCYGRDGESERIICEVISQQREQVVLASKGGVHWDEEGNHQVDGTPATLQAECEQSLQRLGTDVIDLYYLHRPDPNCPIEESAGAIAGLIEQGKIRAAAISNANVQQMQRFHDVCPLTAAQPPYNMLQRDIEQDILPWCLKNGVSVVTYWPLMKGLLAGKIRRGHEFDPQDKRLTYEIFQQPAFEQAQQLLDVLDQVAQECDRSVAQVVVNWTYHRSGILSVLCGAKRDWQIRETAGALGWQLTDSQRQRIDSFLEDSLD